jgi:hypothetical protein
MYCYERTKGFTAGGPVGGAAALPPRPSQLSRSPERSRARSDSDESRRSEAQVIPSIDVVRLRLSRASTQ